MLHNQCMLFFVSDLRLPKCVLAIHFQWFYGYMRTAPVRCSNFQPVVSRATKQATPPQDGLRMGTGAAAAGSTMSPGPSPFGTVAGGPAGGEQQANRERERVRAALTRLVQNDAFVDMLTKEFRAAGLM